MAEFPASVIESMLFSAAKHKMSISRKESDTVGVYKMTLAVDGILVETEVTTDYFDRRGVVNCAIVPTKIIYRDTEYPGQLFRQYRISIVPEDFGLLPQLVRDAMASYDETTHFFHVLEAIEGLTWKELKMIAKLVNC